MRAWTKDENSEDILKRVSNISLPSPSESEQTGFVPLDQVIITRKAERLKAVARSLYKDDLPLKRPFDDVPVSANRRRKLNSEGAATEREGLYLGSRGRECERETIRTGSRDVREVRPIYSAEDVRAWDSRDSEPVCKWDRNSGGHQFPAGRLPSWEDRSHRSLESESAKEGRRRRIAFVPPAHVGPTSDDIILNNQKRKGSAHTRSPSSSPVRSDGVEVSIEDWQDIPAFRHSSPDEIKPSSKYSPEQQQREENRTRVRSVKISDVSSGDASLSPPTQHFRSPPSRPRQQSDSGRVKQMPDMRVKSRADPRRDWPRHDQPPTINHRNITMQNDHKPCRTDTEDELGEVKEDPIINSWDRNHMRHNNVTAQPFQTRYPPYSQRSKQPSAAVVETSVHPSKSVSPIPIDVKADECFLPFDDGIMFPEIGRSGKWSISSNIGPDGIAGAMIQFEAISVRILQRIWPTDGILKRRPTVRECKVDSTLLPQFLHFIIPRGSPNGIRQYSDEKVKSFLDPSKMLNDKLKFEILNSSFSFLTRSHLWCLRPEDWGVDPSIVCEGGTVSTEKKPPGKVRLKGDISAITTELNADVINVWMAIMQSYCSNLITKSSKNIFDRTAIDVRNGNSDGTSQKSSSKHRQTDSTKGPSQLITSERMRLVDYDSPTSADLSIPIPKNHPKWTRINVQHNSKGTLFLSSDFFTTMEVALKAQDHATDTHGPSQDTCRARSGFVFARERLTRFFAKQKLNPWCYRFVVFPINYMSAHWVVLVADSQSRELVWMDSYWSWYHKKFEEIATRCPQSESKTEKEPISVSSSPKGGVRNLKNDDLKMIHQHYENQFKSKSGHPYDLRAAHKGSPKSARANDPETNEQLAALFGSDICSVPLATVNDTVGYGTKEPKHVKETEKPISTPPSVTLDGSMSLSEKMSEFIGWLHFAVIEAYLDYDFKNRFGVCDTSAKTPAAEIYRWLFAKPWKRIILNTPNQGKETMDCGVYACQFARCVGEQQKTDLVDFADEDIREIRLMMAVIVGQGRIDAERITDDSRIEV